MSNQYQSRKQKPKEQTALYDEASERIAIGYFLVHPTTIWDFTDRLKPEHFSHPRLGRIWSAMLKCANANKVATRALVGLYIKGDSGEDTALKIFLEILANEVLEGESNVDIELYAETLIFLADKRALIESLQNAIAEVKTAEMDVTIEEIRDTALTVVTSSSATGADRYIRTYAQVGEQMVRNIIDDRSKSADGVSRGLKVGLAAVTDIMGPLMPGGVYVLAGMSGGGKTALTKGIMEAASLDAREKGLGPVYMASMEMTGNQHAARAMAGHLRIPSFKIERSSVNEEEFDRIAREGVQFMSQFPILIDEKPRLSLPIIRTRMLSLMRKSGISLCVIDHLLLMSGANPRDSFYEKTTFAATEMKIIAKELNIPILVLSQVKEKDVMARKSLEPNASDLYGGEVIQQNADFTGFIHRPELTLRKRGPDGNSDSAMSDWEAALDRLKGKAVFYSDKGRSNGSGQRRDLRFNGPSIQFEDIE